MNNKIILIVVALVVVGGGVLFINSSSNNSSQSSSPSINKEPSKDAAKNTESELREITSDEVKSHSTKDDCWTIVGTKVYDITSYIPRHQGGDEIIRACGSDGTSLFKERKTTDGEKVGTGIPHSSNAENDLENLVIGDLKS